MKSKTYTAIAMIILVGTTVIGGIAQTSGRPRLVANIPFEFNVGEKVMPAGEYTVTQITPSADRAVLHIRNKHGDSGAMIQMNNLIGKTQNKSRLVFNRYGDEYFFAEAWIDGDANGLSASKSRVERIAATRLNGIVAKRENVALRAR